MADHDGGGPQTGTASPDTPTAAPAPDAAPDGAPDAPAVADDVKARFREALERKQGAGHRSAQGRANTGTVHGPETTGGGKRTFRRKTG